MDALERRVRELACWAGPVTLEPLKGGLTNIAFVATDNSGRYVVRCGGDIAVHQILREREREASIAAHEAGLSPAVVRAEPGILVLRFIEGRTLEEKDIAPNLGRIVPMLKRCHREVPRLITGTVKGFWVFQVIREYVRIVGADRKYAVLADRLESEQVPMPIVFGHHDLLPANFIDDGERLWLIDWEYGAFGTAMFDLANLSSNGGFGSDEDNALLVAYFEGNVPPELRRAFEAMKAASLLREALWALVSEVHLKKPGIDYQAHAREYFRRLELTLADLR
jgi:thiamine kinase-like enzyme